jgi:hypothetical protein
MQPPPPANPAAPGPPVHGQPQYQQPQYQQPYYPVPPMQPVWQPMAVPAPVIVDGFYIVQPRLKPILSGPAVGSLVAGIGGVTGAIPGMISAAVNPWAGLTFFMFAGLFGLGSVSLAVYAKRQIRGGRGGVSGGGVATTGLILGIVACSLAALTGLIALLTA